jgi:hypothetical protein
VEELLAELEPLLYGHNYQVFLRVYRVPFAPHAPAESYIAAALGSSAVVGEVAVASRIEVVAEVEDSLRYAGDEGSGPEQSVLDSQRFKDLVLAVIAELERAISGSTLLTRFCLLEGHPAYPVFWDFAFVIAGQSGGLVFVGSSSD